MSVSRQTDQDLTDTRMQNKPVDPYKTMKTKFFMCMRPTVIETEDGSDYIKLPPTVGSSYTTKTLTRRTRNLHRKKRVAPEKYTRQLSIKSNGNNCFSGDIITEGNSEHPLEKNAQKATTSPVSVTSISRCFSGEKGSGQSQQSNSGMYLMASSLFFTIFLGKFFGILCTLILVYSINPRRKNDVNDGRRLENMVVESPEKGSSEEYNKKVIMEGLLERKSYHKENVINFH